MHFSVFYFQVTASGSLFCRAVHRACSVYLGDFIEYTGQYSVHQGDIMISVEDIMSTLGFPYKFNCFSNSIDHDIPRCTHDISRYAEHP